MILPLASTLARVTNIMFGAPGVGSKMRIGRQHGNGDQPVAALVDEVEAVIDELAEDREQGVERRDEDRRVAGIAESASGGRLIDVDDEIADDARRTVDDIEALGVIVAEEHAWRKARQGLVVGGRAVVEDLRRQIDERLIGVP